MYKYVLKRLKKAMETGEGELPHPSTQRIGVLRDNLNGCTNQRVWRREFTGKSVMNEMEWLENTACTAGLSDAIDEFSVVKGIVSLQQNGGGQRGDSNNKLTKAMRVQFLDILINHTPYGVCVVEKDPEYAEKYGLIVDADYPSNIIVGLLMAQRLCWEYTRIARNILAFAEAGVDKSLSFLLGHAYSRNGLKLRDCGHICWDPRHLSRTVIKNYMMGESQIEELPYSVEKTYHQGISNMWGDDGGEDIHAEIRDSGKEAGAVTIPNPFAKTMLYAGDVSVSFNTIVKYFKIELPIIMGE